MKETLLGLLTLLLSTAAVEFCVLRRWYLRRSLASLIIFAAAGNGIFWTVIFWTLASKCQSSLLIL
jgi:hypothetical protein